MAVTLLRDGHSSSINSCAVVKDATGRILTGGESGELVLWSNDGDQLETVTIEEGQCDVTSIYCLKNRPYLFYCAYAESIFLYDLRNFNAAVEKLTNNNEEVNEIVVNEKEEFLASCDDTGDIKVYNLMNKSLYKTLRKHTSFCSSIAFRPKRPWDLLSTGYDHRVIQWDFSRGKAVCDMSVEDIGVSPNKLDSYVVNPPMVHSLSLSKNGTFLACGVQNSEILIFDTSKKQLSFLTTLQGHSDSVAQVHFAEFSDNLLISGGKDGKCNLWNMEDLSDTHQTNGFSEGDGTLNTGAAAHVEHSAVNSQTTSLFHTIHHAEKVNCIRSGSTANRKFFVVADVGFDATVYTVPNF